MIIHYENIFKIPVTIVELEPELLELQLYFRIIVILVPSSGTMAIFNF